MKRAGRLRHAARAAALFVFAVAAGAACRDALEPFRPDDRPDLLDLSLVRLTYSSGDDRMPAWSADGRTIYYTASDYDGNTAAPATVLAVPADASGPARPLLQNVQTGIYRGAWVGTPAVAADGAGVAFVHVRPLLPVAPCVFDRRICPIGDSLPMVRLTEGDVHARSIDATHALADDLILPLEFAGHSIQIDPTAPGGLVTVSEYHPFQLQFEVDGVQFYRPSWSPDGTRLVVSDGLRLLRWTIGAAEAEVIPGTEDGILPAWSPDGEWIAYTRHPRVAAETFTCEYEKDYMTPAGLVAVTDCIERRTMHFSSGPFVVRTRPDGADAVVLGEGSDPAWSPDGQWLYASVQQDADTRIVRMAADGSGPTIVPGTERGVEPAVSPDGRRLAFARRDQDGSAHDIWVVELP